MIAIYNNDGVVVALITVDEWLNMSKLELNKLVSEYVTVSTI